MEKNISAGLKMTFLVHIIVGALFGFGNLVYPRLWSSLGVVIKDPEMYRLLGAAILGFTASSWWAYNESLLEKVKIVVQMEIVWTILAALVLLGGLLTGGFPAMAWVNFVIMAGFAAAFIYFYARA